MTTAWLRVLGVLLLAGAALVLLGLAIGSDGWSPPGALGAVMEAVGAGGVSRVGSVSDAIVFDIRLPRSLGAWVAGALLGLGGAIAQGVFRNPLADPYLLGSASGASLGVALLLAGSGLAPATGAWLLQLGLTGAAFVGAFVAVGMTLVLARGVHHSLRLLLAGVVVGVVLGAAKELVLLAAPQTLRAMQAFMLGTTGFLAWHGVILLLVLLAGCLLAALAGSRALDALSLGDTTARSLGLPLGAMRLLLVATMALATAGAVAQAGLIAFVGLVAPHLVRRWSRGGHTALLLLSAAAGGVLLLAADVGARWAIAPQELPVGVITSILGGAYLLWLMFRRPMPGLA